MGRKFCEDIKQPQQIPGGMTERKARTSLQRNARTAPQRKAKASLQRYVKNLSYRQLKNILQRQLKLAGSFDGAEDGLRFVEAFLVFGFGDGVGDDAGAGLDVALTALGDHGANGDG